MGAGLIRNAFPAMRIFVFGEDITDDVASCAVTWHDGRSPNTATISLASKGDRYVFTDEDCSVLYGNINVESSLDWMKARDYDPSVVADEVARVDEQIARAQRSVGSDIRDPVKARILAAKFPWRQTVNQETVFGLRDATRATQVSWLTGKAWSYPYQVGDCIFHSSDPVRIFWRDPFDRDAWYYMFTGFVSDWVESCDPDGERTVELKCEDATRILRYARVMSNPSIFDIEQYKAMGDTVLNNTFIGDQGLSDLTFPEFVFTVVFGAKATGTDEALRSQTGQTDANVISGVGASGLRRVSVNGATLAPQRPDGTGAFNYAWSSIYEIGPQEIITGPPERGERLPTQILNERGKVVINASVEDYMRITSHKVEASDLTALRLDVTANVAGESFPTVSDLEQTLTPKKSDGTLSAEAVLEYIGTHPELYPVDNGRVFMLIPASLGTSTERSKTLLFRDIMGTVDTKTTAKTRLGMIYDVCQRLDFSCFCSPKGDFLVEMPLHDFDPADFGDLKDDFRISEAETIAWQRGFTDDRIRTQLRGTYVYFAGNPGLGDVQYAPDVVTLTALIPQFGVRSEDMPTVGFIETSEGLRLQMHNELNKWNSDARSARIDIVPLLTALPNRPLEFQVRSFMATTRSVTHTLTWNSDMTTALNLNRVRGWDGATRNGRKVYSPLGGLASQPLNYPVIMAIQRPSASTNEPEKIDPETRRKREANIKTIVDNIQSMVRQLGYPTAVVEVSSAYRTPEHNTTVGGAKDSWHTHALAVDLTVQDPAGGLDLDGLAELLRQWQGQPLYKIPASREIIGPADDRARHGNHVHFAFR